MTIPKQKSRTINVKGIQYRWICSSYECGKPRNKPIRITVHIDAKPHGAVLTADVSNVVLLDQGVVSCTIQAARAAGWDPTKPGPLFRFTYHMKDSTNCSCWPAYHACRGLE